MNLPPGYQKLFSILIFIGSLALSLVVLLIPINPDQLSLLGYGGIFIICLLGAMTLFIPGPTMVAAFLIGARLNPFFVALVAGFGSALGETTGYLAGMATRGIIQPGVESGVWQWRIFRWMGRFPFFTLFAFSAVPNPLTDVSGLIAGRMRYPYLLFLLATFFGKTIRFGIASVLGAVLGVEFFKKIF